jgi:hypothetical protein
MRASSSLKAAMFSGIAASITCTTVPSTRAVEVSS